MFCKAKYLTHQAACNAALAFTCCFFFLCACGLRYNESENTSKNRGKLKKKYIYIYIYISLQPSLLSSTERCCLLQKPSSVFKVAPSRSPFPCRNFSVFYLPDAVTVSRRFFSSFFACMCVVSFCASSSPVLHILPALSCRFSYSCS